MLSYALWFLKTTIHPFNNGQELKLIESERDLDVIISKNLKRKNHFMRKQSL